MITADYAALMARYNAWQNKSVITALDSLDEAEIQKDRGAYFGSIFGTLNHLLWADRAWMSRFDGWARPETGIRESPTLCATLDDWKAKRIDADKGIRHWAGGLSLRDLSGDLRWLSGATGREESKPYATCVAHFFNHQTHHRGQVHAMLTAAGARTDDTDLVFLPHDI